MLNPVKERDYANTIAARGFGRRPGKWRGAGMKSALLERIVQAVVYEGYILYPYRASAKKNQRERFTFGRVYPEGYSVARKGAEAAMCQTECLVRGGGAGGRIEVTLGFLQAMPGRGEAKWFEARERNVVLTVAIEGGDAREDFSIAGTALRGVLEVSVTRVGAAKGSGATLGGEIFKVRARATNFTGISELECAEPDAVLARTFASTHFVLEACGGEFVSALDPPADVAEEAKGCKNIGVWPVLVGDEKRGERGTVLASPIILYDYPRIAPESPGPFFDGTEIDEMLTLRVMTMTDGEKLEMRRVDEQARRLLERTEASGARELMGMHGVMRRTEGAEEFFNPARPVEAVVVEGRTLRAGSSVRVRPRRRADAIDMMLEGKLAKIEAIEQDAEGKVHLALVIDGDPGADLGMARLPGHRFFYGVDEVEPAEGTAK